MITITRAAIASEGEPRIIEVTKGDITAGRPGDCERCPIALAVARAIKRDDVHVSMSLMRAGDYYDSNSILWNLSKKVQNFIRRFDEGKPVKPFRFRLPDPIG